MKILRGGILAILLVVVCCNTNAVADIQLAKIYNSNESSGTSEILTGVNLYWTGYRTTHPMSYGVFGSADIGVTVSVSRDTSNEFDFYASLLTSGTDDIVIFRHPAGASGGGYEHSFLNKLVDSPYVDLYGYTINRIDLTVNNITISSPGSNPNGDGIWTDFSYDVTYTIYGTPEPATIILLGLGAVMARRKNPAINGRAKF